MSSVDLTDATSLSMWGWLLASGRQSLLDYVNRGEFFNEWPLLLVFALYLWLAMKILNGMILLISENVKEVTVLVALQKRQKCDNCSRMTEVWALLCWVTGTRR